MVAEAAAAPAASNRQRSRRPSRDLKEKRRGYKRSLIYHTWVTLSSTLLGFALGLVLGVSLSLAIVYSRVMDLSVMPWVITSQTIPIIAIAPMIIVLMAPLGFTGLMPKGVISMYLSYFPIVIGMTKPAPMTPSSRTR